MPNILLADDQYEILHALKLLLKQEGYQTALATSPQAVLQEVQNTAFDLILIDLNYTRDTTSGREGLDLIAKLRAIPHSPPVIVMTAWSTVPLAVEAMRLGATDFIEKPWDNTRLLALVAQHLRADRPQAKPVLTAAADLEIARTVQHRLLPQEGPGLATLDYAVRYQPAGAIGGDYYDFLRADDDLTAFVVADVSGKGISAAILMATIQSFFRSRLPHEFTDLKRLVACLNTLFYRSSPAEHYATLFVMTYSERDRSVQWINCGHTAPLLAASGGSMEEWAPSATVLGMFANWDGTLQNATLHPGDTLLLFSDGLIEACNEQYEEFGTERLIAGWNRWKDLGPVDLVRAIANAVENHNHGPLVDDLTILAIRGKSREVADQLDRFDAELAAVN